MGVDGNRITWEGGRAVQPGRWEARSRPGNRPWRTGAGPRSRGGRTIPRDRRAVRGGAQPTGARSLASTGGHDRTRRGHLVAEAARPTGAPRSSSIRRDRPPRRVRRPPSLWRNDRTPPTTSAVRTRTAGPRSASDMRASRTTRIISGPVPGNLTSPRESYGREIPLFLMGLATEIIPWHGPRRKCYIQTIGDQP